jgi:glycerol kinase
VHVTDVTNASRTMMMDLHTRQWDPELCALFGAEQWMLPAIRSSAEVYGQVVGEGPWAGVPLAACAGDQQAALVGHRCLRTGEAKNTYGTGCFLLFHTGAKPVVSRHGLVTTVAYQVGPHGAPAYALEVRADPCSLGAAC